MLKGMKLTDYKNGDLLEVNKSIYKIEEILTEFSCIVSFLPRSNQNTMENKHES